MKCLISRMYFVLPTFVVFLAGSIYADCPPSALPYGLSISGRCSFRRGDTCAAVCPSAGWTRPLRCLGGGRWGAAPPCPAPLLLCRGGGSCRRLYAPPPSCPRFLRRLAAGGDCDGDECRVTCGPDVRLTCQPSPPKCRCPPLEYAELVHCSGDACQVLCPNNRILEEWILCLSSGEWSSLPRCHPRAQCARARLPSRVVFLDPVCKASDSAVCQVGCLVTPSPRLVWIKKAVCSNNGYWLGIPDCKRAMETYTRMKCGKPELESYLTIQVCQVGEMCQLVCRKGGRTIGPDVIRCVDGDWTEQPLCACPFPDLRDDLLPAEDCTFKLPGTKCLLSCKGIKSKVFFTVCRDNYEWSALPTCPKRTCPVKHLPYSLLYSEECTAKVSNESCRVHCRGNGTLIGSELLTCIGGSGWSPLPKCFCPPPFVPDYLSIEAGCNNKTNGESCRLSCKKHFRIVGPRFLICTRTMKWTEIPECMPPLCPTPELSLPLIYVGRCVNQDWTNKCEIRCKDGGEMDGPSFITCSDGNNWSELPKCHCAAPSLSDGLRSVGKCDKMSVADRCYLKCYYGSFSFGKNFISCQRNFEWSKVPKCREHTICQAPKLPLTLKYKEECFYKRVHQHCYIGCKKGGRLVGPQTVQCLSSKKWSKLPECACPIPRLKGHLYSLEICSRKRIGERCYLSCNDRRRLSGRNHITCLSGTSWSSPPFCLKSNCPVPQLRENLDSEEDCSGKSSLQTCKLKCKGMGQMIGSPEITCIDGTQWSSLPYCACPEPELDHSLVPLGTCFHKIKGEKCQLKCKRYNFVADEKFIECYGNNTWSALPKCDCSKPKLSSMLSFREYCISKIPGEICRLKCREGYELRSRNFIVCRRNLLWSPLPVCTRIQCTSPKLNRLIHEFKGECKSKSPGDACYVRCKNGGVAMGEEKIICRSKYRWSSVPECACPTPVLPAPLRTSCRWAWRGEACLVRCPAPSHILKGRGLIWCMRNAQWGAMPTCVKIQYCPRVGNLSSGLHLAEKCSHKKIGSTCQLSCESGRQLLGDEIITCSNRYRWNGHAECSCVEPDMKNGLVPMQDCSKKRTNEVCVYKHRQPRT